MTFFGSGTPVSKLVTDAFPPMLASCIRMGFAALVLMPFALYGESPFQKMKPKVWGIIFLVALIGNVAFSLFMLYGMQIVSGVVGSVVMSMTPAITATAAVLFMHEQMNRNKMIALILAVAGVVVINVFSGSSGGQTSLWMNIFGAALVFGAVCSEATYTLLGKKAMEYAAPLKLAFLAALMAVLMFMGPAIWQGLSYDWQKPEMSDWAALAWWGIGTMGLGSLLWYKGVNLVPGHIAAACMAIMPVSALVLSYVLLGEQFHWSHGAGFGLTFTGVILIIREHMKMAKQG